MGLSTSGGENSKESTEGFCLRHLVGISARNLFPERIRPFTDHRFGVYFTLIKPGGVNNWPAARGCTGVDFVESAVNICQHGLSERGDAGRGSNSNGGFEGAKGGAYIPWTEWHSEGERRETADSLPEGMTTAKRRGAAVDGGHSHCCHQASCTDCSWSDHQILYSSEILEGTLNPDWQEIDKSLLPQHALNGIRYVQLRTWVVDLDEAQRLMKVCGEEDCADAYSDRQTSSKHTPSEKSDLRKMGKPTAGSRWRWRSVQNGRHGLGEGERCRCMTHEGQNWRGTFPSMARKNQCDGGRESQSRSGIGQERDRRDAPKQWSVPDVYGSLGAMSSVDSRSDKCSGGRTRVQPATGRTKNNFHKSDRSRQCDGEAKANPRQLNRGSDCQEDGRGVRDCSSRDNGGGGEEDMHAGDESDSMNRKVMAAMAAMAASPVDGRGHSDGSDESDDGKKNGRDGEEEKVVTMNDKQNGELSCLLKDRRVGYDTRTNREAVRTAEGGRSEGVEEEGRRKNPQAFEQARMRRNRGHHDYVCCCNEGVGSRVSDDDRGQNAGVVDDVLVEKIRKMEELVLSVVVDLNLLVPCSSGPNGIVCLSSHVLANSIFFQLASGWYSLPETCRSSIVDGGVGSGVTSLVGPAVSMREQLGAGDGCKVGEQRGGIQQYSMQGGVQSAETSADFRQEDGGGSNQPLDRGGKVGEDKGRIVHASKTTKKKKVNEVVLRNGLMTLTTQRLLRTWKCSMRDALAERLDQAMETRARMRQKAEALEEQRMRVIKLKAAAHSASVKNEMLSAQISETQDGVVQRIHHLTALVKAVSDARGRLQEAGNLLAGEGGYGHLAYLGRALWSRRSRMIAQLLSIYPLSATLNGRGGIPQVTSWLSPTSRPDSPTPPSPSLSACASMPSSPLSQSTSYLSLSPTSSISSFYSPPLPNDAFPVQPLVLPPVVSASTSPTGSMSAKGSRHMRSVSDSNLAFLSARSLLDLDNGAADQTGELNQDRRHDSNNARAALRTGVGASGATHEFAIHSAVLASMARFDMGRGLATAHMAKLGDSSLGSEGQRESSSALEEGQGKSSTTLQAGMAAMIAGLQLLVPSRRTLGTPSEKQENEQSATALGYAAHVVSLLGTYLDVRLRYPIRLMGSRSSIWDPFPTVDCSLGTSVSGYFSGAAGDGHVRGRGQGNPAGGGVEFPLYNDGKEPTRFAYAVFLLNKDIEQIMNAYGMSSLGPRHVVQNLQKLVSSFCAGSCTLP